MSITLSSPCCRNAVLCAWKSQILQISRLHKSNCSNLQSCCLLMLLYYSADILMPTPIIYLMGQNNKKSAQCEYNNLQNQTDVSDLSSVVAPTIFSSVHPVMPPQRLHIVISVSVPCQPVWIPSLKSWCRDNRAPLFWISLSSSFHPTLLLCVSKTRFLMPTGSDGREQVSLVSSYAKKKKKAR